MELSDEVVEEMKLAEEGVAAEPKQELEEAAVVSKDSAKSDESKQVLSQSSQQSLKAHSNQSVRRIQLPVPKSQPKQEAKEQTLPYSSHQSNSQVARLRLLDEAKVARVVPLKPKNFFDIPKKQ